MMKKISSSSRTKSQANDRKQSELIVCYSADSEVKIVHFNSKNNGGLATGMCSSSKEESIRFLKQFKKRTLILSLLPKSEYLLKIIEIPEVLPQEVHQMLLLETEANLPAEFGKPSISYRPIFCDRQGYQRYEVYISRNADLEKHVKHLEALGCNVDRIIPSAIAWRGILSNADHDLDMLVVNSQQQGFMEIVSVGQNEAVSIRTVHSKSQQGKKTWAHEEALAECIRSIVAQSSPESFPLTIGWIGKCCNIPIAGNSVTLKEIKLTYENMFDGEEDAGRGFSVNAAAFSLTTHCSTSLLNVVNLIPKTILDKRLQCTIRRNIVGGLVILFAALLLAYLANEIAIHRYDSILTGINRKVLAIKTNGEKIGRRIEQLEAIRAARSTRNDLYHLLGALHHATPSGISYSNVELNENRQLRFRGQAKSLALPFLLPQELEKERAFSGVVLKDAGQVKKSGGTITEFRIECTLKEI